MNDNEEQKDEAQPIAVAANSMPNFVQNNELKRTLKKLAGSTDECIDFLMSVVKDDKADMKVRVDCAKTVLDKRISVSESMDKSSLARMVAQSRLMLAQQSVGRRIKDVDSEDDDEGGNGRPVYMPNVLLDHSSIKEM